MSHAGREQAQAKIRRLKSADLAKDVFLSELAHELRTPLTAILGWASLLRVRKFDPDVIARGLETIEMSARSQAQLIDDLADLSRVVTGNLRLEMQPMDLGVAVRAALEGVRPSAEAKGVRLLESLSPATFLVYGDRHRLRQVVGNLLTNAVKFTPPDGTVTVWLERIEGQVRVTVRDTGRGIPAKFLPFVFDRFRQAETGEKSGPVGLGLGMAIVRQLMELQGGRVSAESAGDGMGATFTIELPEATSARAGTSPSEDATILDESNGVSALTDGATHATGGILAGVHVLLVEDDEASRTAIAALLEESGAEVLSTSSVNEAMLAVAARRPNVLVSDIRMPGVDGFALIRQLRAAEIDSERIPAVALTGGGGDADRQRALAEGFELYMHKPVGGHDLANAVAGLMCPAVATATPN